MRKVQETEEYMVELHGNKSNLLLEAMVLLGTGNPEEAIERFALAAPMEVRIARYYSRNGDPIMAARHRLSAAICYAKSGSLRDALKLFTALGRDVKTPGEYKVDALFWLARIRQLQREVLQPHAEDLQQAA